jgi:hypothetical protein
MFEDLWNDRLASAEARRSSLKAELAKAQRDVEQFLDRIAKAQLPSVVTASETRIRRLEERRSRSWRKSPIAAARCAASTRHLELRSISSQTPAISGVRSAWSTRRR